MTADYIPLGLDWEDIVEWDRNVLHGGENIDLEEVQLKEKVASYHETLRKDPKNVPLWLEFADFELLKGKGQVSYRASNERKSSILERAMHENPDSEVLILAYLDSLAKYEE